MSGAAMTALTVKRTGHSEDLGSIQTGCTGTRTSRLLEMGATRTPIRMKIAVAAG